MAVTIDEAATDSIPKLRHHAVVIVGGGTAGITVAARLRKRGFKDVAVVEPSNSHYYQPLWTLVGGGVVPLAITERPEASVMPRGVNWIKDAVAAFHPDRSEVELASGQRIGYDYLIVAPGIQVDFDRVRGLTSTLGKNGVTSNYRYDLPPTTWDFIRNFRGGTALFTFPAGPIKCAGAPQKIMYLAADYFRRHGIKANIIYATAGPAIFGVKLYQAPLMKVVQRYGIDTRFNHDLVEIDGPGKTATFERVDDPDRARVTIPFDFAHVTPPQSAPDVIKNSPLSEAEGPQKGYVAVDRATLRHVKFPNVFALGDAGSTPNSKTGAAIRKQAPVLVENLVAAMEGRALTAKYDGYASCPLITGYGKLILAEFDYEGNAAPSIPIIDTKKERWSMYMVKRHVLPWLYWNLMLKGRA